MKNPEKLPPKRKIFVVLQGRELEYEGPVRVRPFIIPVYVSTRYQEKEPTFTHFNDFLKIVSDGFKLDTPLTHLFLKDGSPGSRP